MEQYNHFAYGLELTQKLKLFKKEVENSFHKAPNSDTLASISNRLSDINYPVLVAIDGKDSTFADNGAESLLKTPQYFFMFLEPATDDPDAILTAQAECEANALQVMAVMIQHSRKYLKGLMGLQPDSFTIASIGPIGDCLYGVIMGFTLQSGIDYRVNKDFWNSENTES
jgi:hypothetical protein